MWPTELERQLYAEACRTNFSTFVRKVYGVERNPKGTWWDDAVHGPLCRWLQDEAIGWLERRRLGIRQRTYIAALLPRGAAKTNLITKALLLWLHLHDPEISCYIGNEKRENAIDFLSVIKDHLAGADDFSWWQWLYGSWRTADSKWRLDGIVHAARKGSRSEASFGILSVGTGLTGKHPDVICLDDLVSYEGLESDVDHFQTAYNFISSLIPVVEADGLIIMVGTRYGDGDPMGKVFASMGIKSVAGMTTDKDYQPTDGGAWSVYFLSGRNPDGSPAIPSVWSEAEMKSWERMDPVKYAFQVLNRPSANPFRQLREDEFDACLIPGIPSKLQVSIHLDTAFRHTSRQAAYSESAIVALGHDTANRGILTFLGAWSSRDWDVSEFSRELISRVRAFEANGMRVRMITDEAVAGGKSGTFESGLRADFARAKVRMPRFLTLIRQGGPSKDVRITEAIAMVRKGLLRVWAAAPGLHDFRYQLCSHPGGAKNDIIDAFADGYHQEAYSAMAQYVAESKDEKKAPVRWGAWEAAAKSDTWRHGILYTRSGRAPIR